MQQHVNISKQKIDSRVIVVLSVLLAVLWMCGMVLATILYVFHLYEASKHPLD